jgi:hypothetical protein
MGATIFLPACFDNLAPLRQSLRMKEVELRALVKDTAKKPLRICMDDGKIFTISHPDYGMVADGALLLGAGPGHNLGGASFVVCYFEHISRLEQLGRKAQNAK